MHKPNATLVGLFTVIVLMLAGPIFKAVGALPQLSWWQATALLWVTYGALGVCIVARVLYALLRLVFVRRG